MLVTMKEKTKGSMNFMEEAKKIMPGGVTANIKYFDPYPIVMKGGKGAYLTDIDNNDYIDYSLSYSALILGHGHPKVQKAIFEEINKSGTWLFGSPHQLEVDLGKILQQHYPSMELLRYTNSGTEGTLLALRISAAYTKKKKIAKFEGHYHGGHNQVLVSVDPLVEEAGDEMNPAAVPSTKGLESYHQENSVVLPFNNNATFEILRAQSKEIGAVILEPIQGGFIPANKNFLKELRKVTKELGILLIFDEVKTGFRVGLGGAQEMYGIQPDITVLGKAMGGGFPIGVVGGKKDIMMECAPAIDDANLTSKDSLFHSGTYNGHPLILAAGIATIKVLEKELKHVFSMTGLLKKELEYLFLKKDIPMQAMGLGSMFNIVLTENEIKNYRDYQNSDLSLRKKIDYMLLEEGIYTKPLSRYSLSTEHGEIEIEKTVTKFNKVLSKI